MLHVMAFFLLSVGAILEVAGISLGGIDLLIGLVFFAAMGLGALSAIRGRSEPWGMLACGLSALALGLHGCLYFGWLF